LRHNVGFELVGRITSTAGGICRLATVFGSFDLLDVVKSFGGQLGEQAGKIVVFFAIGPVSQFDHALGARSQFIGIT